MESYLCQAERYFIGGQIKVKGGMKIWQRCGSIIKPENVIYRSAYEE
jgi:hypothetical protein